MTEPDIRKRDPDLERFRQRNLARGGTRRWWKTILLELVHAILLLVGLPCIAMAFTGVGILITLIWFNIYMEFLRGRKDYYRGAGSSVMWHVAGDPIVQAKEQAVARGWAPGAGDDTRSGDLGYRPELGPRRRSM